MLLAQNAQLAYSAFSDIGDLRLLCVGRIHTRQHEAHHQVRTLRHRVGVRTCERAMVCEWGGGAMRKNLRTGADQNNDSDCGKCDALPRPLRLLWVRLNRVVHELLLS